MLSMRMRRAKLPLTILIIALVIACWQVVAADTIYLRNGRKLEGRIVRETDRHIEVEVEYGSVTINRKDIERIELGPVSQRKARKEEPPEQDSPGPAAPASRLKPGNRELEEYLKLPEDEINIAHGALLIAKGVQPSIDVSMYLRLIDDMAGEVKELLKRARSPLETISVLNHYLLTTKGYQYDEKMHFPSDLLDRKRGNCVALSVMYLALGERLNLPFHGVAAPQHMFVRYDDGSTKINVESTLKGKLIADEKYYVERFKISWAAIEKKYYLRNLTRKESLAGVLVNRGGYFSSKGDYDQAIWDCTVAIGLDPTYVGAYFNRGSAYYHKGDSKKALEDLDRVISFDSKFAPAYHLRGIIYGSREDYGKAVMDLDMAISLNPEDYVTYCKRANILALQKRFDKAIADCDKAISLKPEFAEAYYVRGLACHLKEDLDKALEDYRKAVQLDPAYHKAYVRLGMILKDKGDSAGAKQNLDRAVELDPNYAYAYLVRASIYSMSREKERMLADLKKAIALDPSLKELVRKAREFSGWHSDEDFRELVK